MAPILRQNILPLSVILGFVCAGTISLCTCAADQTSASEKKIPPASPTDAVGHFLYGALLNENHLYTEAIEELHQAVELDPDSEFLRLKYAQALICGNKVEDAFPVLTPLAEKAGEYASDANILLATVSLCQDKKMNAVSYLHAAITFDPQNKMVYQTLTDLYEQLNLTTQAADTLKKAVEMFPDQFDFRLRLAQIYFNNNQIKEALSIYETMNQKDKPGLQVCLGLAYCHDKLKHPAEAVTFFETALRIDPLNSGIYRKLIKLKAELLRWDDAFKNCTEWMSLEPAKADPYLQYAMLSLKAGRLQEGISFLQKNQDKFPNQGNYAYWLARLYHTSKDLEQASLYYQKALDTSQKKDEIYYWFAVLMHDQKKNDAAMELVKKAIAENDQNAPALNFMGYLILQTDQSVNEAIILIEKALKLEPENPAFLDSMGWALYKKGNAREAVLYQEKAVQILKTPLLYGHLAKMYEALGQREKARKCYLKTFRELKIEKN